MVSSDPNQVIDQAYLQELRELELELIKTRNQAEAARLDARAAELELSLSRLGKRIDQAEHALDGRQQITASELPAMEPLDAETIDRTGPESADGQRFDPVASPVAAPRRRIDSPSSLTGPPSWRRIRPAAAYRPSSSPEMPPAAPDTSAVAATGKHPQAEHRQARSTEHEPTRISIGSWQQLREIIGRQGSRPLGVAAAKRRPAPHPPAPRRGAAVKLQLACETATADAAPARRKRRPMAWLGSALFHAAVLLVLAFWTMASQRPADQIALAGAVSDSEEVVVESVTIESEAVQPIVEEPQPQPVEVPSYQPSEIGELPFTPTAMEAPTNIADPLAESLVRDARSSAAAMSMASTSELKMEFCGIEGGGNHFVYLVDSSASMGDAFRSARDALLRSIQLLRPDQRFYVVFFDSEPDYMRLTAADQKEPHSVYATPENKASLRRWALGIEMDRGRAPYEALPFAIDLAPDVIFLLSDGEFPARIEEMLKDLNQVENLFGDSGPISIVHTIGYHSREGEERMRRIAHQNGGRYRHIPEPGQAAPR